MVTSQPSLIGIDWGSTSLRAYLFDADGAVLETRATTQGASGMADADSYLNTLYQLTGDWMQTGGRKNNLSVLACGMVGSAHGWQEVPYVECVADINKVAANLVKIHHQPVHIIPGLICSPDNLPPDVMRGEETQLIGALRNLPNLTSEACIVLPGTHSKWARTSHGTICAFATHMTGELFFVLRQHSVLGRLLPESGITRDDAAFLNGVRASRDQGYLGLSHQLFSVRSLGLTKNMNGMELTEYLSGLLIGHEVQAGLNWRKLAGLESAPLVLAGDPELCRRYVHAMSSYDVTDAVVLSDTAPAGLWSVALASGITRQSLN
ncbi:2-keto-3-deoxy-galactonokinase [Solimicrobium silvestre]|uniref:2-keto-3-deoxy-galactonokinase n=2 Tax=Solimicrobium silvestre TaxID=2099400 RepID=A0A2S9H0C1_9BURK|nr:2-keto-3-deoxy-galactonokinase [Solimicrobium silvestre]